MSGLICDSTVRGHHGKKPKRRGIDKNKKHWVGEREQIEWQATTTHTWSSCGNLGVGPVGTTGGVDSSSSTSSSSSCSGMDCPHDIKKAGSITSSAAPFADCMVHRGHNVCGAEQHCTSKIWSIMMNIETHLKFCTAYNDEPTGDILSCSQYMGRGCFDFNLKASR